ncbi:MAG: ribonuclease H-like domain-containing protein [Sedimentibacter sp.]
MITEIKEIADIASNDSFNSLIEEAFFIDIETTGLSREYSNIISITVLLSEKGRSYIHQIFCEYKIDEPEALKYLKDLIKTKKYIITYNGNTFDIPFLESKFQKHNINFDLELFIKIDLYNWIRQLKNKFEIENFKLKTVEKHFNIKREDTLCGKDIITLYEAYRIEPRKEFSYLIMQHNYEDVFNLPILFNNIINMYDNVLSYKGLIVKINNEDFKIKKNSLICKFNILSNYSTDYVHPAINFNLKVNSLAQTMKLDIPVGFYKNDNIKEFYFIDSNEYNIKTYTAIDGIKRNLMPVKFNDKIFYNNINNLVKSILESVF